MPKRATTGSAGYDFYSPIDVIIQPNEMVMIWTDVKAHMYYDNALLINVRSSMGKQPIMIANTQEIDPIPVITGAALVCDKKNFVGIRRKFKGIYISFHKNTPF